MRLEVGNLQHRLSCGLLPVHGPFADFQPWAGASALCMENVMRAIDGMKRCSMCKETMPVAEFHKHKNKADGLQCRCRACMAKWRNKHPEAGRVVMRKRRREHPGAVRAANRRCREKLGSEEANRRNRAHNAVYHALKDGTIVKPDCCSRCPATAQIEAHHHDHAKQLDVVWLCRSCHRRLHVAMRHAAIESVTKTLALPLQAPALCP